ncbi:MAG: fibronectin type III domain-containing protein, partial [Ferruginibacter sp.]
KKDAGYQLQWENIADNYTSVTGYILLRKASNETEFFPVAQHIIEGAVYTDSSQLIPGIKYEYAVAAIDYNGSVGQLSPSVYYEPKTTNLKPPSSFTAFIDNGKIKIKWPDEANKLLNKKINIYRKSSSEKAFKLIGSTADNDFTDEKTVSNVLYTYSLSVSVNNMESEKSITQSVRAK